MKKIIIILVMFFSLSLSAAPTKWKITEQENLDYYITKGFQVIYTDTFITSNEKRITAIHLVNINTKLSGYIICKITYNRDIPNKTECYNEDIK